MQPAARGFGPARGTVRPGVVVSVPARPEAPGRAWAVTSARGTARARHGKQAGPVCGPVPGQADGRGRGQRPTPRPTLAIYKQTGASAPRPRTLTLIPFHHRAAALVSPSSPLATEALSVSLSALRSRSPGPPPFAAPSSTSTSSRRRRRLSSLIPYPIPFLPPFPSSPLLLQ